MQNYVSLHAEFLFCSGLITVVSVGLGWTPEQKEIIIQDGDFNLEVCQFNLSFTFYEDHTDEMFTVPTRIRTGQGSKRFTFFLLHLEEYENPWQRFVCPMSFPQCHYHWCVTGENKMVIINTR